MGVQAFSKGKNLVKDSKGKAELQSVMKMIFFSYSVFKSASVSAPSYFNLTTLLSMAHSIGTWKKLGFPADIPPFCLSGIHSWKLN